MQLVHHAIAEPDEELVSKAPKYVSSKKLPILHCLFLYSHFSFRKYLMNFYATDDFVYKTYLKFLQLIL